MAHLHRKKKKKKKKKKNQWRCERKTLQSNRKAFSNNKKYINCLYRYSPVGDPNVLGHIHVHNIYHLN